MRSTSSAELDCAKCLRASWLRTFEIQVDVGNATLEEQAANAAQEAADVLQGVPELQVGITAPG